MDNKAFNSKENQLKKIAFEDSYAEDDGRSRGVFVDLNHGEDLRHLSIASTSIEQSGGCEEDAIDSAKC